MGSYFDMIWCRHCRSEHWTLCNDSFSLTNQPLTGRLQLIEPDPSATICGGASERRDPISATTDVCIQCANEGTKPIGLVQFCASQVLETASPTPMITDDMIQMGQSLSFRSLFLLEWYVLQRQSHARLGSARPSISSTLQSQKYKRNLSTVSAT